MDDLKIGGTDEHEGQEGQEIGVEESTEGEDSPEAVGEGTPGEENSWSLGTPVASVFEECESCSA